MIDIILCIISITGLVNTRHWINNRLQSVILLLGGSRSLALKAYSFIFLPGVIIHELSHFLAASLLAVRTGEIKIFPESTQTNQDHRVALGSVQIAKTDFIRGSLIGSAPFVVGCILLFAITHIIFKDLIVLPTWLDSFEWIFFNLSIFSQLSTWFALYGLIMISNTMFMSKEDTRPLPFLGLVLLLIFIALFLGGQLSRFFLSILPYIQTIARALTTAFVITLIINGFSLTILFIIQRTLEKLTRRHVVFN